MIFCSSVIPGKKVNMSSHSWRYKLTFPLSPLNGVGFLNGKLDLVPSDCDIGVIWVSFNSSVTVSISCGIGSVLTS